MKNLRIMIVEGESDISSILDPALREACDGPIGILICGYAETALRRLKLEPFDLLITDRHLPDLSGTALILQARKSFPNLKAVLITLSPLLESETRVREAADLVVTKPFQIPALIENIRGLFQPESTMKAKL